MMICKMPKELESYIKYVEKNPKKCCKKQQKLIKYIKKVFQKEELFWDNAQITKYLSYQKYFPFDLFDWEIFCFILHNCVFDKNGRPRWPELLLVVGRGTGKNGYLSFEDFCLLTETHGIRNYNIDICATAEEQAKTTFKEIHEVLENPKYIKIFKKHFYWTKECIKNLDTNSEMKFHTNNAKSKDGLRPGKVDFDEVHAYENWANIEVFTGALGKISHQRTTYISSKGDVRDGPLDELLKDADDILDDVIEDNGMLVFICELDEEEEVHDEVFWNKPNPSLRFLPELLDTLRKFYKKYKRRPELNLSFMTKRMNYPKGKKEAAVTSYENIKATDRPIPDLTGFTCVAGVDYASVNDMVSAGLLFKKENTYFFITKSWFCTRSADKPRIKAPLDNWAEMNVNGVRLLEFVDAVEISPYVVTDWLAEMGSKYTIKGLALDNFKSSQFEKPLRDIGFEYKDREKVKLIRPSDIMKIVRVIESIFNTHSLCLGNNPLMRWFINNTKLVPRERDNFEYGKIEKKSRKTDGFMAFVAAMIMSYLLEDSASIDIDDFDIYAY